jgi:glucuronokinase
MASGRAPARVALAGNPSDGYGGRTLAVCVPGWAAEAVVEAGPPEPGRLALVDAAVGRFRGLCGLDPGRVTIRLRTSIPREVGLGGSSAIVIATLRALAAHADVELDPQELAAAALAAEVEDLGIAAGPQDRIVQSLGGLVAMDFASGRHERLDPRLLPPLFVAHRAAGGERSGVVHGSLRERWEAGDAVVRKGMRELADHAAAALAALVCGDVPAFGRCMDASFDARARMIELDPRDVRLVEIARAHGAPVNYAGSGGAVVGVLAPGVDITTLRTAYGAANAHLTPVKGL